MNKDRETIIIVRKKKGGHGHHGGAWKVAFADFMTAMFALFLVLWLVNQSSDVKAAVAGYFQDPLGRADEYGASVVPGSGAQPVPPRPTVARDAAAQVRSQLEALGERIREELRRNPAFAQLAEYLEIEITREGLRLQLLEDSTGVFFETGSAVPKPRAREFLQLLARELSTLPNGVVIDGYTDAVPYSPGAVYTNWELSADRANTTRRILASGGLPDGQVREVRGHADRELRVPRRPHDASNRRVTITMLFADAEHPLAVFPAPPADTAAAVTRDTLAATPAGGETP